MAIPRPIELSLDIFDRLEDKDQFERAIRLHHNHYCFQFGFTPTYSEDRLSSVYEAYSSSKKRLGNSLPSSSESPDHFKMAGTLVFWLRRFAIIYHLKDLSGPYTGSEKARTLLEKYSSELPAFELGIALCNFFEQNKASRKKESEIIPAIDFNYLESICYVMRFKNISPHSLGMLYRSLYVPLIEIDD